MYADLSVGGLEIGDGGEGVLSPGSCLFVFCSVVFRVVLSSRCSWIGSAVGGLHWPC